jgi:hypothetical protein
MGLLNCAYSTFSGLFVKERVHGKIHCNKQIEDDVDKTLNMFDKL